ncbi:MAG: LamG domain-containing protein, partial [Candidatus Chisholmbacteria bacterium]|nr:LamG domain-containing protein [Candidatus Chisholmbacteria bacterium]
AQAFSPNQKYLSDGLAGYWKADETSGNMADSSGNATTLTDTNTVTFSAGKFANGGDFESGSSEYQFAADNAYLSVTSSLTISAWIKPESVTASTSFDIAGKWDGANESYLLEQFGDEIRLSVDSSSNYATTDAANLATGTFYHVVGVYDSTSATVRLYVNGVLSASTVTGTIPSSIGDDAGRFHIGAEDSTTTAANFYDGFIDDIRVYNRALSKFDVESLSNWAPGPVGYWKMDENTGTSANDSSTSGNGGTTTGETWVPGKYGSSLSFNATTSRYVTLPSSSVYNSSLQSVSLWVYLNRQVANTGGTEFWTFVTTAPSDESKGWAIQYWDNNVACGGNKCLSGRKWTPEVTPTVTYTIPVQTWTHLEATWDGTNVYMYVNGVLISTTSSAAPTTGASAGCIGGDSRSANCGAQNPDALIDDVKVYNYTRTSKQVVEDMNAGHPTGGSPVGSQVIYYKFDEQQGTTINNSIASQSFTETVTGTTWKVAGSSNCKINGCLVVWTLTARTTWSPSPTPMLSTLTWD